MNDNSLQQLFSPAVVRAMIARRIGFDRQTRLSTQLPIPCRTLHAVRSHPPHLSSLDLRPHHSLRQDRRTRCTQSFLISLSTTAIRRPTRQILTTMSPLQQLRHRHDRDPRFRASHASRPTPSPQSADSMSQLLQPAIRPGKPSNRRTRTSLSSQWRSSRHQKRRSH